MADAVPHSGHADTVEIRFFRMGRDAVFLVTGGTAHLGAVAIAYSPDGRDARAEVLSLPGHREGELAAGLARMASEALGCAVAVLAGIHLHQPSRRDIERVVAEARRKMEQVLADIQPSPDGNGGWR
jgi:hypothetical protein